MPKAWWQFKGFVASLVAVVLLAAIWHLSGWTASSSPGYPITSFFTGCFGVGFCVAYLVASWLLGRFFRHAWAVALGMLAPLPFGLIYEIAKDPTNHNLFPFEIAMVWVPVFAVTLGAALLGVWMRGPARRA